MNVLLTSCGLETRVIEKVFTDMLPCGAENVRAMFIPTAASSPGAVGVLPKCLGDLLRCGIREENITVYDLYDEPGHELIRQFEVIYFCGGDPGYLLRRIRERGFDKRLDEFISAGGIVVGVSAGSMIFADDMPGNLGLLRCPLDVHCGDEEREKPGRYDISRRERIRLGNRQGIYFQGDGIVVFE